MMNPAQPCLEHILGDTWCIVTDFCRIPLYLKDRSRAVMIDSGLKNPDRAGILSLLEREGIRVESLLTSHFHRDHIGNHSALRAAHGCAIYMTPYAEVLAREDSHLLATGYEVHTPYKPRESGSACLPDGIIPPKERFFTASDARFELLWLPGHVVEQIGFVTPDGVAYVADTLLSDHVLQAVKLPYYTFLREDLQAKESLRELQCSYYILAHNGVYERIDGLIDRNIAVAEEKLALVERLADRWMTQEQLCAAVMTHFRFDLNSITRVVGSKRNIRVLMDYLVQTERLAVRVRDGFVEYLGAK